jgi:hypothetical protein
MRKWVCDCAMLLHVPLRAGTLSPAFRGGAWLHGACVCQGRKFPGGKESLDKNDETHLIDLGLCHAVANPVPDACLPSVTASVRLGHSEVSTVLVLGALPGAPRVVGLAAIGVGVANLGVHAYQQEEN